MEYKSFKLDQFQIDALKAIDRNNSVVVSAATGTGKTLIADYVINEAIRKNKKVIYTSPIKALSNQKFSEFKEAFGHKVGLLTGDIAINADAPVLIMTTEIYRNMLLEQKKSFPDLSYVIFDEIHYINDIERGAVWEESIIFSPEHIRFLCLSATIPNYRQFADWIESIKEHKVETINYMKRAVPLKHEFFDSKLGICDISELKKDIKQEDSSYYRSKGKRRGRKNKNKSEMPDYKSLINHIKKSGMVPAIFFTFSRKNAFAKGLEISRKNDFLKPEEKKEVIEVLRKEIPDSIAGMQSVKDLRQVLIKGVGVHHAGILPKMKEIVEKLFGRGLLRVLFATETFAVGINMPAKTVILDSIKKYDGYSVRTLSSKEYFQMAGRAGRRGIDTKGQVYVVVDRNDLNIDEVERVTAKDVEPITSRYSIGYNTTLNLIKNFDKDERETVLKSNFGFFLKKKKNQSRVDQSYVNYTRILKKMDYVNEEDDDLRLTWKGNFATHIFSHELVITELYYNGIMKELTENELAIFLCSLEYEPRMSDRFYNKRRSIDWMLDKISASSYIMKRIKKRNIRNIYVIIDRWMSGAEFQEIVGLSNIAEGDIIRLFRRLLDVMKQIKSALASTEKDEEMINKINNCMKKIDRDVVEIEF
ncbi:MAG: DEAD/DEAH box helicase [Nanobdellota archaeon]